MDKIPTIYRRDERWRVTDEVTPGCEWVQAGEGIATEKLDGTNVRVTVGGGDMTALEKRRNPTREQKAAGEEPGYVPASRADPSDKWIFDAADSTDVSGWPDGAHSAEALGPKIQGNPLGLPDRRVVRLVPEALAVLPDVPRDREGLRAYMADLRSAYSPGYAAEGIVFHHPDGRMAKIKVKDWPR